MEIKGVAAIVTGGASGLGAAAVEMLVGAGASVSIFDIDEARGRAVAERTGSLFHTVDVRDEGRFHAALLDAERHHGTARILVHCAGALLTGRIVDDRGDPHPLDRFREMIDVNLTGTFVAVAQFAARLARAEPLGEERGVIVTTASSAAHDGSGGLLAYAAAKAGVSGMILPLARDLADRGVRVVAISPGIFNTPLNDGFVDIERHFQFPRRKGRPSEYAMLIESIVRNPMVSGDTIRLDGAVRLLPPAASRPAASD